MDYCKKGEQLHKQLIVIDALNVSQWSEEVFKDIQDGGITAINATMAIWENFRDSIQFLIEWNQRFEQYKDIIMRVDTVADIRKAKELGKVAIILGFQNSSPIEEELGLVPILKQLGIRIIQLVYMQQNYVGGGCLETKDGGLSKFGLELIEEMNRVGILIVTYLTWAIGHLWMQ